MTPWACARRFNWHCLGMDREEAQQNVSAGITWMIVTGLLFVGVTGIVRYLGADIPAPESAFIRYLAGTLIIFPIVARALMRPRPARAWAVFTLRGVAHSVAVSLWFFAMARIPIAEVTAIGYTAPIYITIGAALFLGEHMAARRIIAVGVAFLGALVIIRPGFREIEMGHLAQLLSAPLFAVSYLTVKSMTRTEKPGDIVAILSVFVTLGLLPMALWDWVSPSLHDVIWLSVVAGLATLGHYTMTRALEAAPVAVTQPITFLQLVWATALGALAFGEAVDGWVLTGGGIIIASVSFISWREARLKRQSTPPAPATKG